MASLLLLCSIPSACSTQSPIAPPIQPTRSAQQTTAPRHTLAPGLRIDPAAHLLEFDAIVALDCHHPDTPDAYLELIACTPDTREHESLIVTTVRPALIHAGLLSLAFRPGSPGRAVHNNTIPPTGDPIQITFITTEADGRERATDPAAWITDAQTRTRHPHTTWVFAGSRVVSKNPDTEAVYDADLAGTLIGLATFGSETIAPTAVFSPDAATDAPVWIADPRTVPARGTPVRVRIQRAPATDQSN